MKYKGREPSKNVEDRRDEQFLRQMQNAEMFNRAPWTRPSLPKITIDMPEAQVREILDTNTAEFRNWEAQQHAAATAQLTAEQFRSEKQLQDAYHFTTGGTQRELTASDIEFLTYTLLGEAEGEGPEGQLIVANIIANRAREGGLFPSDPVEVAAQPYQFSTHNKGSGGNQTATQRRNPVGSDGYQAAERVVRAVFVTHTAPDITGNAVQYHSKGVAPSWATRASTPYKFTSGAHVVYARQPVPDYDMPTVLSVLAPNWRAPRPVDMPASIAAKRSAGYTPSQRVATAVTTVKQQQMEPPVSTVKGRVDELGIPISDTQWAVNEAARRAKAKAEGKPVAVPRVMGTPSLGAIIGARVDAIMLKERTIQTATGPRGRGSARPVHASDTRVADNGLVTHIRPLVKIDRYGDPVIIDTPAPRPKIAVSGSARGAAARVAAARVAVSLATGEERYGVREAKVSTFVPPAAEPAKRLGSKPLVLDPSVFDDPYKYVPERVAKKEASSILPADIFRANFGKQTPSPTLKRIQAIGSPPKLSKPTTYGNRPAEVMLAGTGYEKLGAEIDTMTPKAPVPRPASERPTPAKVTTQTVAPQKPVVVWGPKVAAVPGKPVVIQRPVAPRVAVPGPAKTRAPVSINPATNKIRAKLPGRTSDGRTPSQQYDAANAGAYRDPSKFNVPAGSVLSTNGYTYSTTERNSDGSRVKTGKA